MEQRKLKFRTYGKERNGAWQLVNSTELNRYGFAAFNFVQGPILESSYESVTVQFTEALDCEHNEVWEGDIVKFTNEYMPDFSNHLYVCYGKIIWSRGKGRFSLALGYYDDKYAEWSLDSRNSGFIYKVIGNIFDNPELLEK